MLQYAMITARVRYSDVCVCVALKNAGEHARAWAWRPGTGCTDTTSREIAELQYY